MLYRVHRPSKPDGAFGYQLGYITLCEGHINISYIWKALRDANITPQNWFEPGNLHLSPAATSVYGINAYGISRKAPHRNQLFYLYPIEVKQDSLSQNVWGTISGGTISSGSGLISGGITFTYNPTLYQTAATNNPLYIQEPYIYQEQQVQVPQQPINQQALQQETLRVNRIIERAEELLGVPDWYNDPNNG